MIVKYTQVSHFFEFNLISTDLSEIKLSPPTLIIKKNRHLMKTYSSYVYMQSSLFKGISHKITRFLGYSSYRSS